MRRLTFLIYAVILTGSCKITFLKDLLGRQCSCSNDGAILKIVKIFFEGLEAVLSEDQCNDVMLHHNVLL